MLQREHRTRPEWCYGRVRRCCSPRPLFARYHAGTRTIPRRLPHRLLTPPRGRTVVGVRGRAVVALGTAARCGLPTVIDREDALVRVGSTLAQGPLVVSSSPRS